MHLTDLKGVGPELIKKLAILGIQTPQDLIKFYPKRYDDYSSLAPIARIKPGPVSIEASIKQASGRYARRGMHITEAIASDGTGSTRLVWFNQPYRARSLKANQKYFVSGQYELSHRRFAILNPTIELASDFPINTARIVPTYRETKGLTSKQIRQIMSQLLPKIRRIPDSLPGRLGSELGLMPRALAIEAMHFPKDAKQLDDARLRLGFEEVFELSLASLLNKYELLKDKSLAIPYDDALANQFVSALPFKLTNAQRKVVWQVYKDMQRSQPMNRLVEGDVGSGKTVVAAMAAIMAMQAGYQVACMAPTELLARQHAETLFDLLAPIGWQDKIALLVGGQTSSQKQTAKKHIAAGSAQLIVGTHALIQQDVSIKKLGLVIVDEQHRFGVEQRKRLMSKAASHPTSAASRVRFTRLAPSALGRGSKSGCTTLDPLGSAEVGWEAGKGAGYMPHVLSLTATPIPRSLALTLYGELDITVLDSKPPGRQEVLTKICSPNSRQQLYDFIEQELAAGRQMFVVCPLISPSEGSKSAAAENVYNHLAKKFFKHRSVGLLHGKQTSADKQQIMTKFAKHELDILVSTTVVEVGVDVPNANIMLIESAERFGLAQLHQLRGRVGRGGHKSFCYLMMSDSSAPPKRLQALEQSNDGFKLAELDLSLRGPGAIYGTMQHGALDLRVASLTDTKLIAMARNAAQEFIDHGENLLQYKHLHARVNQLRAVTNLN